MVRITMQTVMIGVSSVLVGVSGSSAGDASRWRHPAGFLDGATLDEIRAKREAEPWAQRVLTSMDSGAQVWLETPIERIAELLPKKKTQVYWLLMCPECRNGLKIDYFNDQDAQCERCNKTYALSERSTATAPTSSYAGALYDGWACYFLLALSGKAQNLALLHALGAERGYAERAANILRLFTNTHR